MAIIDFLGFRVTAVSINSLLQNNPNYSKWSSFLKQLHRKGVNFRCMGLIWLHHDASENSKRLILCELVARSIKTDLRAMFRSLLCNKARFSAVDFVKFTATYLTTLVQLHDGGILQELLMEPVQVNFKHESNYDKELDFSSYSQESRASELSRSLCWKYAFINGLFEQKQQLRLGLASIFEQWQYCRHLIFFRE
jgi:hypothetical protein